MPRGFPTEVGTSFAVYRSLSDRCVEWSRAGVSRYSRRELRQLTRHREWRSRRDA